MKKQNAAIALPAGHSLNTYDFFSKHLWHELNRYDLTGKLIESVTCTEDNIQNLYDSQYADKTRYGQVFLYKRG